MNSYVKNPSGKLLAPAIRNPEDMGEGEVKDMLGEATACAIRTVMQHHYFTIGGEIFRQKDGGSIGLDLTTEIASIYMSLWDEDFLRKCRNLGIKFDLYSR